MLGISNCLLSVYSWVILLLSNSLADGCVCACMCVCKAGGSWCPPPRVTLVWKAGAEGCLMHPVHWDVHSVYLLQGIYLPCNRADGMRRVSPPELLQVTIQEMAWEEVSRTLCHVQLWAGWYLACFIHPGGSFQPQWVKSCSPLVLLRWRGEDSAYASLEKSRRCKAD